jgi:SAM-dependent methyltransferase
MGFYEEISRYYDYIFPTGKTQLEFLSALANEPGNEILDVACGSGGYSVELAKKGFKVTAVDLDEEMVRLAKEKAARENVSINALACDMRSLKEKLSGKFHLIFCIGNSIVHLGTIEEIRRVLAQAYTLLEDNGVIALQTINYDRILSFGINELPPIVNDEAGLKFIRRYVYDEKNGMIDFNTVLSVAHDGQMDSWENTIKLLPLLSSDLTDALEWAGFRDIGLFGDFRGASHAQDSYLTVVKAVR